MKTHAIFITIIFLFLTNCTWMQKIKREIQPVETLDSQIDKNKRSIIKSKDYDISTEIINESQWKKLLTNNIFVNSENESPVWRNPKFLFFHIVITNTGDMPISVGGIKLKYSNKIIKTLPLKEIKKICESPAYSIFDFESILCDKRLLGDVHTISKINFDKDTIYYKFNFINPGDRISKIIAFDWIPVQIRIFKIEVPVVSPGKEKTIDFIFKKFEYRSKGHFSKPKEKRLEKNSRKRE